MPAFESSTRLASGGGVSATGAGAPPPQAAARTATSAGAAQNRNLLNCITLPEYHTATRKTKQRIRVTASGEKEIRAIRVP
jgi:hypothetical protein